jgi:Concanavalin A-like lectin/glucanases superfamily
MKKMNIILLCLLLFVINGFSQSGAPTTGLIDYWPLNGNAIAGIGTLNGNVQGSPALANGQSGNANSAYLFDGIDDWIDFTGMPLSDLTNLTFAVWIKPSSMPQFSYIINHGYDNGVTGNGIALMVADDNNGPSYIGNKLYGAASAVAWNPSGYIFSTINIWYHLAMVKSGSSLTFYVNGINVKSISIPTPNAPNRFSIGGFVPPSGRYFKGVIDEVYVYNRALSSAEITQVMNAVPAGGCSDITAPTNVTVSATPNVGIAGTTSIDLGGTANDNVGVTKMQWFNGSAQIGNDDISSPFGISYIFPSAGTYSITSKAFDACGNYTSSSPAQVTINTGGQSSGNAWSSTDLTSATYRIGRVHIGQANTNIGTDASYGLYVVGGIKTDKMKIELSTGGSWADYVFKYDFNLLPINKLEQFIKFHRHLPNFPSESSIIKAGGYELSDMIKRQQVGIESLYLYIIELEKKVDQTKILEKRVEELESIVKK